ncbi:hypothetical protein Hanom_Chr04g00361701 [Helianthus anomalus]
MVLSSIPNPPRFYRLCIVVSSDGCRVGFSPELVAWWSLWCWSLANVLIIFNMFWSLKNLDFN